MRKIIISESQYSKIKNILIENAISEQSQEKVDYTKLGIDPKNGTLTLSKDIELENAQASGRNELKMFKGAIFKVGSNFGSTGILVSNTNYQMVGSSFGRQVSGTKKGAIHYYCKTGKFNIPGEKDTYYNENFFDIKKSFNAMCGLAKNPQVSSQGKGGLVYNSKNLAQLVGVKDKNKVFTIPANTAFTFNPSKNVVEFKSNFKDGLYDCKTATFIIEKVGYGSKFLGDVLSKNLCKTSVEKQKNNLGGSTSKVRQTADNTASNNSFNSEIQNFI